MNFISFFRSKKIPVQVQKEFVVALESKSKDGLKALVAQHGPNVILELVDLVDFGSPDQRSPYDDLRSQPSGVTILHYAVQLEADSPEAPMVGILIDSGKCHINATDSSGRTPLHYASRWESYAAACRLVAEPQCDLDVSDGIDGYTALHLAAAHCKYRARPPTQGLHSDERTVLELLLSYAGRCDVNKKTKRSAETFLHFLCGNPFQNSSWMDNLNGAGFTQHNAKNSLGLTALHQLAKSASGEALAVRLIEEGHGWVLSSVDNFGDTLLHACVRNGLYLLFTALLASPQVASFVNLKTKMERVPAIMLAIVLREPIWAKKLIECKDCDLNIIVVNKYEFPGCYKTVLHLVVEKRIKILLEELIACGRCDLGIQDTDGNTALFEACNSIRAVDPERLGCIKLLVNQEGTDIDHRNRRGHTPLACVAGSIIQPSSVSLAKILIDHGANVNSVDDAQQHILSHFLERNCMRNTDPVIEFLDILLDAGLDHDLCKFVTLEWAHAPRLRSLLAAEGVPAIPQMGPRMPAQRSQSQPSHCSLM